MFTNHTHKLIAMAAAVALGGSLAFADTATEQRRGERPAISDTERSATGAGNTTDNTRGAASKGEVSPARADDERSATGAGNTTDNLKGTGSAAGTAENNRSDNNRSATGAGNTTDNTRGMTEGGTSAKPASGSGMAGDMKNADRVISANLQQIAQNPEMAGDKLFVLHVACDNLEEIKASQAAMERAPDQAVKDVAKMIMEDHKAAQDKLRPIAQELNVQLPSELPADKQTMMEIHKKLPPAEFQKAYLSKMRAGHAMAVVAFTDAQQSVKNENLKSYIGNVLPKLKEHAKKVNEVSTSMGMKDMMNMDK